MAAARSRRPARPKVNPDAPSPEKVDDPTPKGERTTRATPTIVSTHNTRAQADSPAGAAGAAGGGASRYETPSLVHTIRKSEIKLDLRSIEQAVPKSTRPGRGERARSSERAQAGPLDGGERFESAAQAWVQVQGWPDVPPETTLRSKQKRLKRWEKGKDASLIETDLKALREKVAQAAAAVAHEQAAVGALDNDVQRLQADLLERLRLIKLERNNLVAMYGHEGGGGRKAGLLSDIRVAVNDDACDEPILDALAALTETERGSVAKLWQGYQCPEGDDGTAMLKRDLHAMYETVVLPGEPAPYVAQEPVVAGRSSFLPESAYAGEQAAEPPPSPSPGPAEAGPAEEGAAPAAPAAAVVGTEPRLVPLSHTVLPDGVAAELFCSIVGQHQKKKQKHAAAAAAAPAPASAPAPAMQWIPGHLPLRAAGHQTELEAMAVLRENIAAERETIARYTAEQNDSYDGAAAHHLKRHPVRAAAETVRVQVHALKAAVQKLSEDHAADGEYVPEAASPPPALKRARRGG